MAGAPNPEQMQKVYSADRYMRSVLRNEMYDERLVQPPDRGRHRGQGRDPERVRAGSKIAPRRQAQDEGTGQGGGKKSQQEDGRYGRGGGRADRARICGRHRRSGLPGGVSDQGQRLIEDLPHAWPGIIREHDPGDLLRARGRCRASGLPGQQIARRGSGRRRCPDRSRQLRRITRHGQNVGPGGSPGQSRSKGTNDDGTSAA